MRSTNSTVKRSARLSDIYSPQRTPKAGNLPTLSFKTRDVVIVTMLLKYKILDNIFRFQTSCWKMNEDSPILYNGLVTQHKIRLQTLSSVAVTGPVVRSGRPDSRYRRSDEVRNITISPVTQ